MTELRNDGIARTVATVCSAGSTSLTNMKSNTTCSFSLLKNFLETLEPSGMRSMRLVMPAPLPLGSSGSAARLSFSARSFSSFLQSQGEGDGTGR